MIWVGMTVAVIVSWGLSWFTAWFVTDRHETLALAKEQTQTQIDAYKLEAHKLADGDTRTWMHLSQRLSEHGSRMNDSDDRLNRLETQMETVLQIMSRDLPEDGET